MEINQSRWKIPEYKKSEINKAGDILRSQNAKYAEKDNALGIIDNWRAAHAYPLHVFYIHLRNIAISRDDIIVAERLKRLSSIINKLDREPEMNLYRMQDIGGCRMIVPTIEEVYEYSYQIQRSRIRHELKRTKDYITIPKKTGYRSMHLIYRYKTDALSKDVFNKYPMLIEIQFRTHLQHIWATAIETTGLLTGQDLKSGQGNKNILRFFALVSSMFAIEERCDVVPETSWDPNKLIEEIRTLNNQYHIIDKLQALSVSVLYTDEKAVDKKGYYILKLNYEDKIINSYFYKPSELEDANNYYERLENQYNGLPYDIVMVRATSFNAVRRAYPNYFSDIVEFIERVEEYL